MKLVFTIFIASLAWMIADGYPFFDDDEHAYARTPLGDAIDKASLKVLKEAYQISDDKNVITSPLGIMLLLSMYSNGAGDGSRKEISNMLGGGDYKQLTESYSGLGNKLADMDPSYLTLANKIYVSDMYQLNDSFTNNARSYRSEVEPIDFTDTESAAKIINKWSDEKTKGHIKSPVTKDILTSDTIAGLFNVIFFQGHWHVPFDASETEDKDFHVDKKTTVKKPTMKLSQTFFYTESEDLGAKLIELPYKETGFRMVVVLPNEVDGLPAILEKVAQKGLLEDVFKLDPSERNIDLEIPKFDIKSKLDLNEILPKVGITQIFREPASGIVKVDQVIISKGFQEAFVKVDEEGATAGAFTGFIAVGITSVGPPPPPPLQFKADHPFMFLILHEDKTLFAGTYTQ